jgi:hypothetical protein
VASAGCAVNGSVSAEVDLAAFFFFADLDSDLTAGFWVVEAAIVKIERGSKCLEGLIVVVIQ